MADPHYRELGRLGGRAAWAGMSGIERSEEQRRRAIKGWRGKARPSFWAKIKRGNDEACWPWLAYRTRDGYGQFTLRRRQFYAHRYAWEIARGSIPKGLAVLHRCDNPPCCNPKHLFLGSQADNALDMFQKRRGKVPETRDGEANNKAKLTRDQVLRIRKLHQAGTVTFTELARSFSVHRSTVAGIVHRRLWKHC